MNDPEVREAFKSRLKAEYSDCSKTLIIDEVAINSGLNRVDIAVFNGSIHGYEIKTDKDKLDRLPQQFISYCSVFDFITVICGPKYLSVLEVSLPPFAGIIKIEVEEQGFNFTTIRQPQKNPYQQVSCILELLWKEELTMVLEQLEISKGLLSKTKYKQIAAAAEKLDVETAAQYVLNLVKMRESWRL